MSINFTIHTSDQNPLYWTPVEDQELRDLLLSDNPLGIEYRARRCNIVFLTIGDVMFYEFIPANYPLLIEFYNVLDSLPADCDPNELESALLCRGIWLRS